VAAADSVVIQADALLAVAPVVLQVLSDDRASRRRRKDLLETLPGGTASESG
jgi:hypothetical protein